MKTRQRHKQEPKADQGENRGVYANEGFVEKDVLFSQDKYGDYMLGDTTQETLYVPADGQTLKERS